MADYVAIDTIWYGNAAAHQPGDPVPEENIQRNGWQDSVAKVGTKAANKAQGLASSDDVPSTVTAQAPAPK